MSRGYPVKGRSVSKAALKHAVDRRLGPALAARVHAHRYLRTAPHALLVLPAEAVVAPQELQLVLAVAAQAPRAHLCTKLSGLLMRWYYKALNIKALRREG